MTARYGIDAPYGAFGFIFLALLYRCDHVMRYDSSLLGLADGHLVFIARSLDALVFNGH